MCRVGPANSTAAIWRNENQIECHLSALTPGNKSVTVISGGRAVSNDVKLLVQSTDLAISVRPSTGPSRGGTVLTLHGSFPTMTDAFCQVSSMRQRATWESKFSFHVSCQLFRRGSNSCTWLTLIARLDFQL